MHGESTFQFVTKAQTLEKLQGRCQPFKILPLAYFTVEEWKERQNDCLERIGTLTSATSHLVVRSSARGEDSHNASMAGAYDSLLNVNAKDRSEIVRAVDTVIAAYHGNPQDEVLVQPMLAAVAVSGVITTRTLEEGAPYVVVDYDDLTGKTDIVTGGTGASKTVWIARSADRSNFTSERLYNWFSAALKLERTCRLSGLDIEFAVDANQDLYLFQVRPLATRARWSKRVGALTSTSLKQISRWIKKHQPPIEGIYGSRPVFGEMADWNPAEMIGRNPRPLARTLYSLLITDENWRLARTKMGYRRLPPVPLMYCLGARPFIDIRHSLNSFLPAGLRPSVGRAITDAWLNRLADHPEFHDKVEFEIALTCLDFCFDSKWNDWYGGVLKQGEIDHFQSCLRLLTQQAIEGSTLQWSLQVSQECGRPFATKNPLWKAKRHLDRCGRFGTLPFAIAARHAFIAESFLKTAVHREALSPERVADFRRSFQTVAGQFSRHLNQVVAGKASSADFLNIYGHLRPGTYDITAKRYDQNPQLLHGQSQNSNHLDFEDFQLSSSEEKDIEGLLRQAQLNCSPPQLLEYLKTAICAREELKFRFTKDLSDALESLADFGFHVGLSREELSYLTISDLTGHLTTPAIGEAQNRLRQVSWLNAEEQKSYSGLHLSYILRDWRDVVVSPVQRALPNFVGTKPIEAPATFISSQLEIIPNLNGKIVLIEQADPGMDWMFTRGIAGLITLYGGPNSHMAVRCAELGLPAAIGCGSQLFLELCKQGSILLNPCEKTVRGVFG